MATKRAMRTPTRVAGNEKGDGEGGIGNGYGNKDGGRAMAMAMKRAAATATRMVGNKEGNGEEEGNCDSNEGSGRQRG
jgi:hypothetical protein